MSIRCPSCDREIPVSDVELGTALAKCTECNSVFRIDDQVEGMRAGEATPPSSVPMPANFTVESLGDDLRIEYRWYSPVAYILLAFCVVWDGFLVVWYSIAFGGNAPLIMTLFPLLHVAVGAGLTYFVVTLFLNRTIIEVRDGLLSVDHVPLPWPGRRRLNSDDVDQVYVTEKLRSNEGRVHRTYEVRARMRDASAIKLLSGFDEMEQALFIEQEIERCLRITDAPVRGEVPR